MKTLKLKVTFQWYNVLCDYSIKSLTKYFNNYEEIKRYVTLNSSAAISCETIEIVPCEVNEEKLCEEETIDFYDDYKHEVDND